LGLTEKEGSFVTDEEKVKAKWPDAEMSSAFAVQPDKTRRWMYCVMSSLKFIASRRKKKRVLNVGHWRFSETEAWSDAATESTSPAALPGFVSEN
jgi:hypothetical protein